jgi:hypothetical protein
MSSGKTLPQTNNNDWILQPAGYPCMRKKAKYKKGIFLTRNIDTPEEISGMKGGLTNLLWLNLFSSKYSWGQRSKSDFITLAGPSLNLKVDP